MIPTARELSSGKVEAERMIEFAKLHVKAALKAAKNDCETTLWQNKDDLEIIEGRADYIINHIPIKESILNAYPDEKIK